MSELSTKDIKFLAGVGPKKAELLKKELEISSYEDMLYHFPYKYVDRSKYYKIRELTSASSHVQIKGKIISMERQGEARNQRLSLLFSDGENSIEIIWFKGIKYLLEKYKTGVEYVIFGKPTVFNGKINMVHPEIETLDEAASKQSLGGLQGLYNTTEKMKTVF